ncbi:MAG: hypothetical protein HZC49_07520 [Nitrospirae bacterium]|nr:hypothetical protein [Nitrospirota bacterium]
MSLKRVFAGILSRKLRLFVSSNLFCFSIFVLILLISSAHAALDFPHFGNNNIGCDSCHFVYGSQPSLMPPWTAHTPQDIDDTQYNTLCWSCHNDIDAPYVRTHSSLQTDSGYGNWTVECKVCHNPHYQRQLRTYGSSAYLYSGVSTEITSATITQTGAGWGEDQWAGMIAVGNIAKADYNYKIIGNTADTLTVQGPMNLTKIATGNTFAIIYGKLIKDTVDRSKITPPKTDTKTVRFFRDTGSKSFADGDTTYDGICEVCHTQTSYHDEIGSGAAHNESLKCVQCHNHVNGFAHGGGGGGGTGCGDASSCHGLQKSHPTHVDGSGMHLSLACSECHDTSNFPQFKDGQTLATTTVCNPCHSPGGTYDGVYDPNIGVKINFTNGVYDNNGTSLKPGKEKWCASCHDEGPSVIQGVSAPNVVGDEEGAEYGYGYTWGYYLSGHKIGCLNCHDAAKRHIDGAYRTYEVLDDSQANESVPTPYTDAYRLANVKGKPAMVIPLNPTAPSYNLLDSFALCFKCHKKNDVMGTAYNDRGRTNFYNATSGQNAHWYHLPLGDNYYDSDWDITTYSTSFQKLDSAVSCVACHNVHGAPNQAMLRHGELISLPGQTNAVPAFNMKYILPGDGAGAVKFTPTLPQAGDYEVFAYWASLNGRNEISRAATNAPITISYNGGAQSAQLTKDLRYNCCSWKSLGIYSFTGAGNEYVEMTSSAADGAIIADGMKWVKTDTGAEVVMDEEAASFLPSTNDWTLRSNPGYSLNDDYRDYGPITSTTAPVSQSVAGAGPGSSGPVNNRICTACHYSPVWHRTPNPLPMVIPLTFDDEITADGTVDLLFGAWVKSPGGVITSVTIDLSVIGGGQTQTLYDDGTHGDTVAGDNLYSFLRTIPDYAPSGTNTFHIIAVTSQGQGEADLEVTFVTPGEIIWDNDSGDGLWSTPENWSADSLPVAGDKVVFKHTSNTNCFADTIPAGLTYIGLNPGYTATLTLSSNLNGGSRTLNVNELRAYAGHLLLQGDTSVVNAASGGTADKPHGAGLTINASNVIVGPSGHISADGQGFGPQSGPGASSVNWASGGSYGGFGTSTDGIRDTFPYGSITEPTALGSGGATVSSGGSGGGAMKLIVSDTVTVRGLISAAGINADGGGSGGSVWIITNRIEGEGTISARGGYNAYRTGGGGRISLQWNSGNFDFDGLITTEGSTGATNGSLWVNAVGGSNAWAEMWNASRPVNSLVAIPPGEYTLNDLRILNGANIECLGDRSAINAASGGTEAIPHGSGVTIHSNNIVIESGGILSADGMGFYPQQGPGTGASNGGSYGGYGMGVDSQRRSFAYGSALVPTALGSGGGTSQAGPGGGAIKLDVSGNVTIDGTLSAVGHGCKMSTAGSGGSIWIVANTIAGSGLINASGGDDWWGTGYSGGGGRIRLDWQTGKYLFNGIVKAEGPDNATNGALWVNAVGGSNSWNELWNASRHVTGSVALPSGTYTISELHIDSGVSLDGQGDPTVINAASGGTADKPHGQGVIINADNITIASTASLNADFMGFRPQQGPGGNLDWGGSYGGYGNHIYGWQRGSLYGSFTEPTALGSGGGGFSTNGLGGGALKLNVSDTITINGTLSANGEAVKGGGGSGGSIWVTADTITGTGAISAMSPLRWASAYSGGGGRISLQWNTGNLSFTGQVKTEGVGTATSGTLWVNAVGSANSWNELWNASRPVSGSVALPSGSYDIAELTIPSGIRLDVQGDNGASGAEGAGVTINSNNITVETGATIRGDSLGFRQRQGPGAATSGLYGASHGGIGSSGAPIYGSETLPVSLGSGGSDSSSGGPGGSAVKLAAENTLTINGSISVNGQGTTGGGGAGGSVLLITDILAGAGSITANGGSNGGGGGRIAVHYNTDNSLLSSNSTANGGSGTPSGGNGTIDFANDADGIYAGMKSAFASDASGGGAGIQSGDQVVIQFRGPTEGTAITAGNIDTALQLSNSHSWLDSLGGIQPAVWSTDIYTNDTLTINLSIAGGVPDVAVGDNITMGGVIRDDLGNYPTGTVILSGFFGSIPMGAVAYWPMDEGSGDKVFEATGSSNDGTLKPNYPADAPAWNPAGHTASALSFDGVNDYVDTGNPASLNPAWREPFSVEAYVKFNSLTNFHMLVTKINNALPYRGWQLCKDSANKIAFYLVDDFGAGKYLLRTSSSAVTTGTWYHVVVTYDGGATGNSINIYLNEALDQAAPTDGANAAAMTTIANTENVKLGVRGTNSYPFKGTMDEVIIYRPGY